MTPKEKAKEIVKKYIEFKIDGRPRVFGIPLSKQFALIAVDMVINCCEEYDKLPETWVTQINYWQEVRQEIEKL